MRKTVFILFTFIGLTTGLNAQNYFLEEIQNNPANDVKQGYRFRITNYLDSLEQQNSSTQFFKSDSAQRAYYHQIISNLNFNIKLNPENPENYVLKGIYKSALYEYDSAEILLNKAIEIDPDYAEAYLERGVMFLTKYEIAKGISDFKKALKINPEYTDAIYNLGYIYFQQGKYNQARKYFEQAIEVYPYHYQSYIQLGYLNLIEKDFASAIINYNKAIEIKPFEPTGYNLRGQMYLYQNKIEEAKADFKKSISLNPSDYRIILTLAYIEMQSGELEHGLEILSEGTKILNKFTFSDRINDYAEAEMNDITVHYKEYTQGYPDDIKTVVNQSLKLTLENAQLYKVHFMLKEVIKKDSTLILPQRLFIYNLYKTGRIYANIEEIDALLEKDSTLAYVYLLKGNILSNMDKFRESVYYYDKAIELAPDYSYAYAMRAWSKFRQGKVESAYSDVELSMKDVNPYLAAVNIKAVLLDALNRYQESLDLYSLAINYFPDQAFLYSNRALTYLEVHDKEQALEDCNMAIELNPQYSAPYSIRGNIYLDMGDHKKALKDYDKAIELDPADKYAVHTKANALFKMNESEKAIELYNKMISEAINVKDNYVGLSQLYYSLEKYDLSVESASRALEFDTTFLDAYIQRARAKSELEQVESALNDINMVLKMDSTHINALFEQSRIYSENDEIDKSTQTLLKIIDIDSTSHVAYGNIGWNYYLAENYEECIKWSEKAVSIDQEALYAMYNIALAYLCMGDFEKSKILYKQYYQLNVKLDEPIREGAIKDLKDLIDKGSCVENARYILKNIFNTDDM